jgi:hypothetical protein
MTHITVHRYRPVPITGAHQNRIKIKKTQTTNAAHSHFSDHNTAGIHHHQSIAAYRLKKANSNEHEEWYTLAG